MRECFYVSYVYIFFNKISVFFHTNFQVLISYAEKQAPCVIQVEVPMSRFSVLVHKLVDDTRQKPTETYNAKDLLVTMK